jgi:hypothetical protein
MDSSVTLSSVISDSMKGRRIPHPEVETVLADAGSDKWCVGRALIFYSMMTRHLIRYIGLYVGPGPTFRVYVQSENHETINDRFPWSYHSLAWIRLGYVTRTSFCAQPQKHCTGMRFVRFQSLQHLGDATSMRTKCTHIAELLAGLSGYPAFQTPLINVGQHE